MNIQVDPTRSNLASAMLNSKIRPRAVVGYGVKIFRPSPLNYVTRSSGSNGVYATGQLEDSGWQNGDKMSGKIWNAQSPVIFFLLSAVLSLPAVQLHKLPNNFS